MENNKLCLLVCDQFSKETQEAIKSEGFEDVMLSIYPRFCEHPKKDGIHCRK